MSPGSDVSQATILLHLSRNSTAPSCPFDPPIQPHHLLLYLSFPTPPSTDSSTMQRNIMRRPGTSWCWLYIYVWIGVVRSSFLMDWTQRSKDANRAGKQGNSHGISLHSVLYLFFFDLHHPTTGTNQFWMLTLLKDIFLSQVSCLPFAGKLPPPRFLKNVLFSLD